MAGKLAVKLFKGQQTRQNGYNERPRGYLSTLKVIAKPKDNNTHTKNGHTHTYSLTSTYNGGSPSKEEENNDKTYDDDDDGTDKSGLMII